MQQAGKLRTRIMLQTPATGEDAAGQPITGWVDVASVWADVRNLSGMETARAAVVSTVKASIRIRWRAGVSASMRVMVGSNSYAVTAVLEDVGKRQFIDLVCELKNV